MSKAEADAWFEPQWKAVKDLADRVRDTVPEVKKFMWLKVLGVIAVVGGLLAVLSGVDRPETDAQKDYRLDRLFHGMDASNKAVETMQAIAASEDQFNIMTANLEVVAAQLSQESMPSAVAAVAEQPVKVEMTTPSRTYSFTSTVGRVYRSVP